MDSQNEFDPNTAEQGEDNSSVIDQDLINTEQCSDPTIQFNSSCLNTGFTPESQLEHKELSSAEENNANSNTLNTEENIASCDVKSLPEPFEKLSEPIGCLNVEGPSNPSPISNTSEGSGIEIALDPVSADDMVEDSEPTHSLRSISASDHGGESKIYDSDLNPDMSKIEEPPGPSNDREDISDEELDVQEHSFEKRGLPSTAKNEGDSLMKIPSQLTDSSTPLTEDTFSANNTVQPLESVLIKGDIPSSNSSEVGEIIDLKFDDAVLKSSGSSFDDEENKASKASREDLEAVSDDELPNASLQQSTKSSPLQVSTNLIAGGEQVSSSDDEAAENSGPVSSSQDIGDSQFRVGLADLPRDEVVQNSSSGPNLQSLDAEPISDEEDISHDSAKSPTVIEGGEAGEIKSPEIGSPISEQGDLMLGEVEPISAEEDSDTDGELPSGDENSSQAAKVTKDAAKFENIDSDEDVGDGELKKTGENLQNMSLERDTTDSRTGLEVPSKDSNKEGYMETISDEEDTVHDKNSEKEVSSLSTIHKQSSLNITSSLSKEVEIDKRINQANFNEHQVELDYEENEGDDVDQKPLDPAKSSEAAQISPESKAKEEGEDGEVDEDGASDKDEGELSDDDCEEGEIKEPGAKKPFIKPVCRFFQRGNCTWGISCRFIHPGVNDKGNYQMIEIPGFKPVGVHARLGTPGGQWQEGPPEEEVELPPPPIPDVPHTETAWERGLRIAKEQRKKASERKEQEPDFEEKRLNLSVDEERELNKENERMPKIIPKDPYYDQQAYEFDEYYKIPQDPWHTGHYDNFEVRYQREPSYSPQYRVNEKPPMPPARYNRHFSPPTTDKFGRDRDDRRDLGRPEPRPANDYPSPAKPPDEWTDPWRRSKSPKQRKPRAHSRGKRSKRSLSDSSNSSRSSRSSSGSSRSSKSGSGSSGSSSRSRSPGPVHQNTGRLERPDRYGDQPRSMVSVRGSGTYNNYDGYRNSRGGRGYDNNRNAYNSRQGGQAFGGRANHYNSYGGGRGGLNNRDSRDQRGGWDGRPPPRHRSPTPDRPLPYVRPRRKSASSRSSSSRSRSRSRSKYSDSSRSRSSSASSRSSSSSSSSAGSADSEHLYRDLGSPSRNPRSSALSAPGKHKQKQRPDGRRDRGTTQSSQRHNHHSQQQPPLSVDRIPHPRDPHPRDAHSRDLKSSQIPLPPSGGGRSDSKYASRNAPQAPVKAKDPLKVVGQKSNIKLTLLPKQQQQSTLGDRPNPLASPPHKRRLSEREGSPPAKRMNLPVPQTSTLRIAADKAAKIQMRSSDKGKSPPPSNAPTMSSNQVRSKSGFSPQKQPSSKSRPQEVSPAKPASKNPSTGAPATATASKAKKSMSSRREELLKQLKAVEDAIARKKSKLP